MSDLLNRVQLDKMRRYAEAARAFDLGQPSDTLDRANYGYYFEGRAGAVNILALLDTLGAAEAKANEEQHWAGVWEERAKDLGWKPQNLNSPDRLEKGSWADRMEQRWADSVNGNPDKPHSRSQAIRFAVQRGEPVPSFDRQTPETYKTPSDVEETYKSENRTSAE
jgi:hypothetical protein